MTQEYKAEVFYGGDPDDEFNYDDLFILVGDTSEDAFQTEVGMMFTSFKDMGAGEYYAEMNMGVGGESIYFYPILS